MVIDLAHRMISVALWLKGIPKVWSSIPHGNTENFFFVPRSLQDEKILLYFSKNIFDRDAD